MNILFVCTGNTCRSPMAQGIYRIWPKKKGLDIKVKSAGIYALDGQSPSTNAIKVLNQTILILIITGQVLSIGIYWKRQI